MVNNNIFLQFLYFLSFQKISQNIFLEGGAALSLVYGVDRVFSKDLDFTIEHEKLFPDLVTAAEEVMKEIDPHKYYDIDFARNKITINLNEKTILSLDIYVLPSNLFFFQESCLAYDNKSFIIKVHSLMDIFAEKITNIFQEDRCEFKDILDINRIFNRVSMSINMCDFNFYLNKKFIGKNIINKDLFAYHKKKKDFKKSFLDYPNNREISFSTEFFVCEKVLINFL